MLKSKNTGSMIKNRPRPNVVLTPTRSIYESFPVPVAPSVSDPAPAENVPVLTLTSSHVEADFKPNSTEVPVASPRKIMEDHVPQEDSRGSQADILIAPTEPASTLVFETKKESESDSFELSEAPQQGQVEPMDLQSALHFKPAFVFESKGAEEAVFQSIDSIKVLEQQIMPELVHKPVQAEPVFVPVEDPVPLRELSRCLEFVSKGGEADDQSDQEELSPEVRELLEDTSLVDPDQLEPHQELTVDQKPAEILESVEAVTPELGSKIENPESTSDNPSLPNEFAKLIEEACTTPEKTDEPNLSEIPKEAADKIWSDLSTKPDEPKLPESRNGTLTCTEHHLAPNKENVSDELSDAPEAVLQLENTQNQFMENHKIDIEADIQAKNEPISMSLKGLHELNEELDDISYMQAPHSYVLSENEQKLIEENNSFFESQDHSGHSDITPNWSDMVMENPHPTPPRSESNRTSESEKREHGKKANELDSLIVDFDVVKESDVDGEDEQASEAMDAPQPAKRSGWLF